MQDRTKVTRQSANKHTHRIRMVFKWAASEGVVPAAVWQELLTVEAIRRGREDVIESKPVRPAPLRSVARVLRIADPHMAALVRLGWLTGARPGELVQMRLGDIDRRGPVWIYRPGSHKNEHRDRAREIPLGPRSQRVLAPFLTLDPAAWIFPGKGTGVHMTREALTLAVRLACREAGCEAWTPNQLRHNAGTRIRKHHGIEAARTVLGHSNAGTTLIYAEADREKAMAIAAKLG
jgi:integrase